MQITPGARYAPSRTLEPPGTMRTRSSSVVGRTGEVSLSKKRSVGCADMSTSAPMRNPKRMPRLTHGLTRQVAGGRRSAARIVPRARASRNSAKRARSAALYSRASAPASASIASRSDMRGGARQAQLVQHGPQPGAGLLLHGDERQPKVLLEHTHDRESGLHGTGVRFDEVGFHERQQPAW